MIDYSPFWETLKKSDMSTYRLIKFYHISGSTIHRLKTNQALSTRTVNDLCMALGCNVDDIMTFIPSDQDQPL